MSYQGKPFKVKFEAASPRHLETWEAWQFKERNGEPSKVTIMEGDIAVALAFMHYKDIKGIAAKGRCPVEEAEARKTRALRIEEAW